MTTRKWGTEQLVNTTTSGSQNDPTITALKGGGFVVAWVDDGVADSRVRYQLYDETGRRIGVEGTTGGSGDQTQPVVTPLDNGGFWIINRDFGTSATDQNLEGYVYAADGVTGAFRDPAVGVGDNPTGAAAAALGSGGFGIVGNVVVWTDLTLNNGDIRMRGFTPGGVSLFNTLTANSTVAGIQDQAAVAASNLDLDPLIAVVWRNADLNSGDIRARIFNEFGVQTTAEFSVADVVAGSQSDPQVVWLNADTFVVVWTNTGNSIQARRFRFDGLPLEDQFTVADPGTGQRGKAVVAALPGGGFVVAFEDTSSLPPENGNGVRLVTFDSSGRPVGPDIVVNTTTSNFQGAPAITALADGRIAVAWTDASATGGDASSRAIRMQIVDPRDGVVVGRNDGADAGLYGHDLVGDSIYGTAFGNRLYGLNGDDLLFGDGGADTLRGGRGDDELTGGAGNDILDGDDGGRRFVAGQGVVFEAQGRDTAVFAANFAQADLKFLGHAISVSTPGEGVDTVQRVELFQFADRTIARDAQDGVDDVYYYAVNPDVLASGLDADAHYWGVGRFEGRNPNSLFDRAYYLQNNPDVAAAGLEPYSHYLGNGWREGRNPSAAFNTNAYLQANPDVAASGENPLLHYLRIGADQGRARQVGFDDVFYLASNPDVAAARIDPFLHYQLSGRAQNRDPSALFDADGYLATYGDVAAAGLDPLSHYLTAGWRENRDPSTGFDTSAYLTAWGDVAAAGVNPLFHYLVAGQFEGRYPINDGVWG